MNAKQTEIKGINTNSFLEKESIGKLMGKYSVPCIISLLVAALYNIVDQIFIANATYLGSYGNAANTVVFPLTVISLAIAVMIGDGCCAYVSICLGAQNKSNAHRSIGNAILLCAAGGLVLTDVYFLLNDQILTAFGGRVNEETFTSAKEYFLYITMGIPFYMFGQTMNSIICSDGSSWRCSAFCCGMLAGTAHTDFRSGQRDQLLYGICAEGIQNLSVYDDSRLCQ